MTRVLVPVSDDPEAVETLALARHLFGDATYLVLTVVPEPVDAGPSRRADVAPVGIPPAGAPVIGLRPGEAFEDRSADYAAAESDAAATAAAVAATVDLPDVVVLGRTGDPARVIVAAAAARDADVIVLRRDERRRSAWFGRSVPDAVLRATDRPVAFVP